MANNFNNKQMYDSMLRWLRLIAHRTARHFQNPNAKHLSSTVKSTCLKCTTRAHRMRSAYHHRLHHLTDFFCFVVVALATGRGRLIHRHIDLIRSKTQNYNSFSMFQKRSRHVVYTLNSENAQCCGHQHSYLILSIAHHFEQRKDVFARELQHIHFTAIECIYKSLLKHSHFTSLEQKQF